MLVEQTLCHLCIAVDDRHQLFVKAAEEQLADDFGAGGSRFRGLQNRTVAGCQGTYQGRQSE